MPQRATHTMLELANAQNSVPSPFGSAGLLPACMGRSLSDFN
jgi:hypothetical protein